MHAEDPVVDEGGHGQAVKAVNEQFPEFDVVASFAWVREGVHSS